MSASEHQQEQTSPRPRAPQQKRRPRSSRKDSDMESSTRSQKSSGSSPSSNTRDMRRTSSKRRLETNDHSESPRRRQPKRSAVQRRRVSFEMDEKKRVKTHVRRIPLAKSLSTQETLWWSKEELAGIMEREQNVFEVFSKCCTSYVDTVLKLWDQCENSEHQQPKSLSGDEIEKLVNAPARGMENDVVITLLPGSRDRAIKSVIETQHAMAEAGYKVRTTTMRRRYRNLSRTASEFAKNIAEGDAQVAAAILRQ
ncbi:expressed unknown protein [Seminavis robusta]|uniref:Uncharacterized protein n=1 Tax=Seminavis robusta TaxID=568900 RepID=A0A9N8HJY9_9STRA|nr:expressed unknown protein [Seminavis robusta]|eukprot:Sro581_g170390.1 n/a (254) ;mRNA; f:54389-55150